VSLEQEKANVDGRPCRILPDAGCACCPQAHPRCRSALISDGRRPSFCRCVLWVERCVNSPIWYSSSTADRTGPWGADHPVLWGFDADKYASQPPASRVDGRSPRIPQADRLRGGCDWNAVVFFSVGFSQCWRRCAIGSRWHPDARRRKARAGRHHRR